MGKRLPPQQVHDIGFVASQFVQQRNGLLRDFVVNAVPIKYSV